MSYFDNAKYEGRVLGFAETLEKAYRGSYAARAELKEAAISTSDFPALFTDVTTVQLQEQYKSAADTQIWRKFARRLVVPNFLPQSLVQLGWDNSAMDDLLASNGGVPTVEGTLPNIPEGTEYPAAFKFQSTADVIQTRKNGARVPVTFETFLNDQWGLLESIPTALTQTALRSEDAAVTQLLVDQNGPNATAFTPANGNQLKFGSNTDGTAALTRDTLKAALAQANSFKVGKAPVVYTKFAVVIPQALKPVADEIADMPSVITVTDGNVQYTTSFKYGVDFEFVVNPFLDQINTVSGATAWFVVPFATEGKAPLGLTFLEGFELPELRVHNDTGMLLSGGAVNPRHGSFRNDTWEMRIRHIYNGASINGMLGCVASDGTAAPTP